MNTNTETALIRKAIKARCPTLHVRHGRGTAYGWVEVTGSLPHGYFTEQEHEALTALKLNHGANFCVISPDEREWWRGFLATKALA